MNPKVKKLWIEALRSGKYKQTTGQLRIGDSFCCLGVLCNLHAQAHPEIAAKEFDPEHYLGELGFLPSQVKLWAGVGSADPIADHGALSDYNDLGKTFPEIAALIEKHL